MMKKTSLALILLVIGLFTVGIASATSISPTSCANLKTLVEASCSGNYELQNDLDCTGETGLTPICTAGYSGTFDGQNHTITGLKIYLPTTDNVGLFGNVDSSGVIKNVGLKNVNITSRTNVGGIVGYNNGGSISYSYTTGTVTGYQIVGGIVGNCFGTVNDCYATGTITGGEDGVGGIAGVIHYNAISNSYFSGNISGQYTIGGIAGVTDYGTVSDSYATGTITASLDSDDGGIVGQNSGTVSNSYWYDQPSDTATSCCGSNYGDCSDCYVESPISYFYSASNPPMNAWDFTNTWKTVTNNYPVFQWEGQGGQQGEAVPESANKTATVIILLAVVVIAGVVLLKKR